jgi:rhomboid protease GluP
VRPPDRTPLRDATPIWATASREEIEELAFVLTAVGIACRVQLGSPLHELHVGAGQARRALAEIERFQAENAEPETQRAAPRPLAPMAVGAVLYVGLLGTAYLVQHGHASDVDWTAAGRVDAQLVLEGQWWRPVTALCLHVDVPHLMGNLVFGLAFGCTLAQLTGAGLGWALTLTCGALANALNAWAQAPDLRSLGASTAVFASLGLLTALSLRLRSHLRYGRLRQAAPLAMGVALLGYLGTAGERTDVAAHVLGFAIGLLVGLAIAPVFRTRAPGGPGQLAGLSFTALLLGVAWWAAVQASGWV